MGIALHYNNWPIDVAHHISPCRGDGGGVSTVLLTQLFALKDVIALVATRVSDHSG
jgi:hypothetical protein